MIPVNEPLIGTNEHKYVLECLNSGWISSAGTFIDDFESTWAKYCNRKYGITTSSGTSALQAAVACLDLQPGDEIIIPTFTIISCALAVIYNNCTPVLVDADKDTWCMDANLIEEKITSRTKAIMPVHIYGHPVDMDPILQLAEKYNLAIIEDAAEAHGAQYLHGHGTSKQNWVKCGSMGTMSIFSFYANKLVTSGEGGMILTDNENLANKAKKIRNLCFEPNRRFLHNQLGHNFRMTNIQAALGLAQAERIDETVNIKRTIGSEYTKNLKDIDRIKLPVERDWSKQVYWMYGILLDHDDKINASDLALQLHSKGIQTRPFFLGMHQQPILQEMGFCNDEQFAVSDHLSQNGLYIPSGVALSEKQLNQVCDTLHGILN